MEYFETDDEKIRFEYRDALEAYNDWESPMVIISDGPYGVNGYPGDLLSYENLDEWYEPHVKMWSEKSTPQTTLWFWNIEIGWATVHPILKQYGWEYVNSHIWNKGLAHIAGNVNTKRIRKLPPVTELCVQYVKKPVFEIDGQEMTMKEWLRYEWKRTGLPLSKTNEAAEVKNAATRKYFTKCHLWYMPPPETFNKIVKYANEHGKHEGRPYFSIDGEKPLSAEDWEKMRPKFKCPIGVTNVWNEPPLNGKERIKVGSKAFHLNQKPLKLIERLIKLTSDEDDVIWDPFGGLATTAIAAKKLNRRCHSAEIDYDVYEKAVLRFKGRLDMF